MSNWDIYQSNLYPFTADAIASYAEYRAEMEIERKDKIRKIDGSPLAKLKTLSPQVRERMKALSNLQGQPAALKALFSEEKAVLKAGYKKLLETLYTKIEHDALKALFSKQKAVLEAKYEKLHESLYTKRYQIVNGAVELEGVDLAPVDHSDNKGTDKGVPNFWLTAMKAYESHTEEISISKRDEEALKFLKDIKCCKVDHPKGFKLDFFFDTNPFFKNSVLTKTCHNRVNKDMAKNVTWTDIEWFPGKCLTKKFVKCNPNERLKSAKPMIRTMDCESFFDFFEPPQVAGLEYQMQDDYYIGSIFRDNIIPNAVLWFTGEAEEDDSIYMVYDDIEAFEDPDMYLELGISRHKGRDNIEEDDDEEDDGDDDDDDDDEDDGDEDNDDEDEYAGDYDDDYDEDDGDDDNDYGDEYAGDYDGEEEEEEEEEKSEKKIQVQHRSPVVQGNGVAATAAISGATATAAPGNVANQFKPMSLYVGDLDINVTETQLYELFNQAGQVISVRICRDLSMQRSLGYGFVNYTNPQDAAKAMEMLDCTPVNGKSIRAKYSHRDRNFPKNRTANLFIRNLDRSIDNKALHDTFSSFGYILSCKVVTDSNGQSKCYGFVQFDNDESAQSAIDKLNGMLINGRQVYVSHALRKEKSGRAQAEEGQWGGER